MAKKREEGSFILEAQQGRIYIEEEVVAALAGLATAECYGVVGLAPRGFSEGLAEILHRDSISRGVKVEGQEGKLSVEVNVVIGYGTRISEVARNIMSTVKYTVEDLTGLKVGKVDVFVRSVQVTEGKGTQQTRRSRVWQLKG